MRRNSRPSSNGDALTTHASKLAGTRPVSIVPSQVNDHVEGFAPHRVDDRFEFVVFGVHGDAKFVHPIAGLVEANSRFAQVVNRRVRARLYVVVLTPMAQEIIESGLHRVMKHGDDPRAPKIPTSGG